MTYDAAGEGPKLAIIVQDGTPGRCMRGSYGALSRGLHKEAHRLAAQALIIPGCLTPTSQFSCVSNK